MDHDHAVNVAGGGQDRAIEKTIRQGRGMSTRGPDLRRPVPDATTSASCDPRRRRPSRSRSGAGAAGDLRSWGNPPGVPGPARPGGSGRRPAVVGADPDTHDPVRLDRGPRVGVLPVDSSAPRTGVPGVLRNREHPGIQRPVMGLGGRHAHQLGHRLLAWSAAEEGSRPVLYSPEAPRRGPCRDVVEWHQRLLCRQQGVQFRWHGARRSRSVHRACPAAPSHGHHGDRRSRLRSPTPRPAPTRYSRSGRVGVGTALHASGRARTAVRAA